MSAANLGGLGIGGGIEPVEPGIVLLIGHAPGLPEAILAGTADMVEGQFVDGLALDKLQDVTGVIEGLRSSKVTVVLAAIGEGRRGQAERDQYCCSALR